MVWGPQIDRRNAYILDRSNGATMLTIPFGHTMAALRDVLGNVLEVSARLESRRTSALVVETGEPLPMSSPDQVVMAGLLENGAPICVHYRGGTPRGTGFLWEINGTKGDIQVTGPGSHAQIVPLTLKGARGDEKELEPIDIPDRYATGFPADVVPGNVARVYAQMTADLRDGTHTAPSFVDAVALHRLIAAVEATSESEGRIAPDSL